MTMYIPIKRMVDFLLPCPVHQSEPGVNRHWAWHFLTQPGPQLADVNIGVSGLVYGENMGKNNVNNGVVCWKKKLLF